jgi:hypothetical protein
MDMKATLRILIISWGHSPLLNDQRPSYISIKGIQCTYKFLKETVAHFIGGQSDTWTVELCGAKSGRRMTIAIKRSRNRSIFLLWCGFRHLKKKCTFFSIFLVAVCTKVAWNCIVLEKWQYKSHINQIQNKVRLLSAIIAVSGGQSNGILGLRLENWVWFNVSQFSCNLHRIFSQFSARGEIFRDFLGTYIQHPERD